MVFAHAPIILPAVARVSVPFHPALYAPLAVLHLGLTARVAGDLLGQATLRSTGAIKGAFILVGAAGDFGPGWAQSVMFFGGDVRIAGAIGAIPAAARTNRHV